MKDKLTDTIIGTVMVPWGTTKITEYSAREQYEQKFYAFHEIYSN